MHISSSDLTRQFGPGTVASSEKAQQRSGVESSRDDALRNAQTIAGGCSGRSRTPIQYARRCLVKRKNPDDSSTRLESAEEWTMGKTYFLPTSTSLTLMQIPVRRQEHFWLALRVKQKQFTSSGHLSIFGSDTDTVFSSIHPCDSTV